MSDLSVRVPARVDFAGGWTDVADYAAKEGGAVLNAAIDRYLEGRAKWDVDGMRIEQTLDLPPQSHLGTSASADVAWLRLTYGLIGRNVSSVQIAEQAHRLANLLGVKGGKQDEYAAALGGFNLLRFGAEDTPAKVEGLDVPSSVVRDLEARCVLCDSREASSSGNLHDEVWSRYRAGDAGIARVLRTLRDTAEPARDALMAGDLDTLAELTTQNREGARRLHAGLVTPRMDELFGVAERSGAIGGKGCGGGGGGFLLLVCGVGRKPDVEAALRERGGVPLLFRFAPRTDPEREA